MLKILLKRPRIEAIIFLRISMTRSNGDVVGSSSNHRLIGQIQKPAEVFPIPLSPSTRTLNPPGF
jgi:hypothetical protein